ncbi:unnamed protein product [Brachionus calyciflorus]|uniref:Uncharacterized protein n=1 Tax=Brachionus calyciflorus TaxID=104777 RepID=A0A813Y607_9BILA|nr:unnamed protein product [Brachionus calyciflorus]
MIHFFEIGFLFLVICSVDSQDTRRVVLSPLTEGPINIKIPFTTRLPADLKPQVLPDVRTDFTPVDV